MGRNFGVDRSISGALAGRQANNPVGYKYATNNDQTKLWNEIDFTLWYRPIEAIKFGLQYATPGPTGCRRPTVPTPAGLHQQEPRAQFGDAHRVEFVGFLFF